MSGLTFAKMESSCYCCGKRGHISRRCPEEGKPKLEWAANKTKKIIHAQQVINQAAADNETLGSAQPSQPITTRGNYHGIFSWSNFQKYRMTERAAAEDIMKDVILLDNQSTVNYFCNQNLV